MCCWRTIRIGIDWTLFECRNLGVLISGLDIGPVWIRIDLGCNCLSWLLGWGQRRRFPRVICRECCWIEEINSVCGIEGLSYWSFRRGEIRRHLVGLWRMSCLYRLRSIIREVHSVILDQIDTNSPNSRLKFVSLSIQSFWKTLSKSIQI